MRAETVPRHDVNPAVQKMLEVDEELGKIKKAPAVFQVDKKVHVAVGSGLATYHGSKDTHIRRAVECGDREDLVSMSPQYRVDAQSSRSETGMAQSGSARGVTESPRRRVAVEA